MAGQRLYLCQLIVLIDQTKHLLGFKEKISFTLMILYTSELYEIKRFQFFLSERFPFATGAK